MLGRGARFGAALIGLALTASVSASVIAYDDASDPAYNGGWNSGTNGGFGWGGGWTFRNGGNVVQTDPGGSFFGRFISDSRGNNQPAGAGGDSNNDGDINTSGAKAWGMYANTSNEIYAVRPLNGALSVGQTVRFAFDNGNVDTPNVLGVRLLANASDISTRQFELRFVGGDTNYTVVSGGTSPTTTVGFSREGIIGEFTLTSPTAYSLTITRLQSNQQQTVTGTLVQPGGNTQINGIAFRNLATGAGASNDGYFNMISVPEPSGIAMLALGSVLAVRRKRAI